MEILLKTKKKLKQEYPTLVVILTFPFLYKRNNINYLSHKLHIFMILLVCTLSFATRS